MRLDFAGKQPLLLSLFYATHPLPPSSFIRMARVYPFVPILSQQISLTVKKLVIRPAVDARPCPRTTRLHRHLQPCACSHTVWTIRITSLWLNKTFALKLGISNLQQMLLNHFVLNCTERGLQRSRRRRKDNIKVNITEIVLQRGAAFIWDRIKSRVAVL